MHYLHAASLFFFIRQKIRNKESRQHKKEAHPEVSLSQISRSIKNKKYCMRHKNQKKGKEPELVQIVEYRPFFHNYLIIA